MTSHLRSILVSVVVAVATTLLVLIVAYLASPVAGIRVQGANMYSESDAWDAVSEHASLLTLNEERLERKVEANPWVEGAEVTENYESGIVTVQVEERRAVLDAEVSGSVRFWRWTARSCLGSGGGFEQGGVGSGPGRGRLEVREGLEGERPRDGGARRGRRRRFRGDRRGPPGRLLR
ncbi:FtsQ-type POTRA domain-containing protein [Rubrobacter tropicus]|uniref:FtsQ-type POTRA domain-containing protein n=1 Tax=Rubrobacter tropicus TaxID=2653851 RepID=A0A6G8Q9B6_9ACTN|nr:FtsQ-type POTRA domain-containing protein [Rubrobacter tropicus]